MKPIKTLEKSLSFWKLPNLLTICIFLNIISPNMYNKYFDLRAKALKYYFNNKTSIRKTARHFSLHYQTVFKWISSFKKLCGQGSAQRPFKTNASRLDREGKIVEIKEMYPALTLSQARLLLQQKGYAISLNGIWNVWCRYGYAGFDWNMMSNDFTVFCRWSREAKRKFLLAEQFYSIGLVPEAAALLNTIPFLPRNDLLLRIPDEYLNLQRKLEKISRQFGELPLPEYITKLYAIYQQFLKKKYYYSAIRAGLPLIFSLSWKGEYKRMRQIIKRLKRFLSRGNPRLCKNLFPYYFSLNLMEGRSFLEELRIKQSLKIARLCYTIAKRHKNTPHRLLANLGIFYITLERYDLAQKLLNRALPGVDEGIQKKLKSELGLISLLTGEKEKAHKLLKEGGIYTWAREAKYLRFKSLIFLMDGELFRVVDLTKEVLRISKSSELKQDIANSYLMMASAYAGLGEADKVKELLKNLIKFTKRTQLHRLRIIATVLLTKDIPTKQLLLLPSIKLAWILHKRGFRMAFDYARKRGITFYLYRYLLFWSETVLNELQKVKFNKIPKGLLKLPIFNNTTVAFRINFLGRLNCYRNQKYHRVRLRPKDSAFLIYLCTKAMEPEKTINLEEVYKNFWPGSETASRNFSHLLVRIKKTLKIPTHLLTVSWSYGEPVLINEGIYFTTDLQEFEQVLAQAKALERAGEWGFARKEYLRAFKLFRGEPFKKNFDDWSVDMRFKILSQLETETINFAKSCLEHKNKQDAKIVLEKVLKIIPDSDGIRKLHERFRIIDFH